MGTAGVARKLDTTLVSKETKLLVHQMSNRVVGQEKATRALVEMVEAYRAGFADSSRPAGNALFLGPTGTGKTHVCETLAMNLFGKREACLRIDCAEFQHSHEIAKLIGSPPGYLGHRETSPVMTQEKLNQYHTESLKLSIVLFDEIEKASDSLWSLLLGILDKATLTLGDNRVVNFSKCLIIMTSNVGAREMFKHDIGFSDPEEEKDQARLEQVAVSAAKSKFSPEFINRLQHIITFKTLTEDQVEQILEIEIRDLVARLAVASINTDVIDKALYKWEHLRLEVSPKAKKTLLEEGYDKAYGARHLKRAIERRLTQPLAKLHNSGQIMHGDTIVADYEGGEGFVFYAHPRPEPTLRLT